MLFIFSTPVVIRHMWQLKNVVFLHLCLIGAVLLEPFLICIYLMDQRFHPAKYKSSKFTLLKHAYLA
jgi:hypothetical protein